MKETEMNDDMRIWAARMHTRDAAMELARRGMSADAIRETMRELAEEEAERAIEWAEAWDAQAAE